MPVYKVFNGNEIEEQNHPTVRNDHRPLAILEPKGEVLYGALRHKNKAMQSLRTAGIEADVYSELTYKTRRNFCDSALGMHMLDNAHFTEHALDAIVRGIKEYISKVDDATFNANPNQVGTWNATVTDRNNNVKNVVNHAGRHASSPTSFGRQIVENAPKDRELRKNSNHPTANITHWESVLESDDVPQKMALVDVFFKIYVEIESRVPGSLVAPSPAKEAARLGWREPWYDKQGRIDQRGRVGVEGEVDVSRLPGIIPLEDKVFGLWALRRAGISNWGMGTYGANDMNFHDKKHKRMFRRRGVDMFKVTDFLEPNYKAKLKKHGLDFSASASGTTSTLIAAAQSFAPEIVQNSGLLKEYVMACTAYLVGGGMHTCHEVFYTASLSGFLNYSWGKYDTMLPASFKMTPQYRDWAFEFADVLNK